VALLLLGAALACRAARAEDAEEGDDPLSEHRLPFDVLAERTIGTTSRPVEFNWRRTQAHVAVAGDHLFELNNFDSYRAGARARFPSRNLLYEVGLGYVFVLDTTSSRQLALTPYRQPGRPERLELDLMVGIPLAEGVVTTAPRWFPAAELVFSAYAGLRYSAWPGSQAGMRFRDKVTGLLSPTLGRKELENLETRRLQAMAIDPTRYTVMVGLGNDIYFRQGVFVAPRVLMSLPVISAFQTNSLLWWGGFDLAVGVAF
jgi:hypothetical protein